MKFHNEIYLFIIVSLFLLCSCNDKEPLYDYKIHEGDSINDDKLVVTQNEKNNNFKVIYTDKVLWSQEPIFPVSVVIIDVKKDETIKEIPVEKDAPFIIEAILQPGEYKILSKIPKNGTEKIYEDAYFCNFTIALSGNVEKIFFEKTHYKHLELVYPVSLQKIDNLTPLLKWNPLNGAENYTIMWTYTINSNKKFFKKTTKNHWFQITEPLSPGAKVSWTVVANSSKGNILGQNAEDFKVDLNK